MDTLRAVNSMANAETSGLDGTRSPGGAELNRRASGLAVSVNKAIVLAIANGLNPDEDRATQTRLANAIDRQVTGADGPMHDVEITRRVMNDMLFQEAAARQLEAAGERDPLSSIASPHSNRENGQAFEILSRNGIAAATILRSASKQDLEAIAGGRFDKIETERARFAVGAVLGLSEQQMNTPTHNTSRDAPRRVVDFSQFPATGLGAGPITNPTVSFGRKGVER